MRISAMYDWFSFRKWRHMTSSDALLLQPLRVSLFGILIEPLIIRHARSRHFLHAILKSICRRMPLFKSAIHVSRICCLLPSALALWRFYALLAIRLHAFFSDFCCRRESWYYSLGFSIKRVTRGCDIRPSLFVLIASLIRDEHAISSNITVITALTFDVIYDMLPIAACRFAASMFCRK